MGPDIDSASSASIMAKFKLDEHRVNLGDCSSIMTVSPQALVRLGPTLTAVGAKSAAFYASMAVVAALTVAAVKLQCKRPVVIVRLMAKQIAYSNQYHCTLE